MCIHIICQEFYTLFNFYLIYPIQSWWYGWKYGLFPQITLTFISITITTVHISACFEPWTNQTDELIVILTLQCPFQGFSWNEEPSDGFMNYKKIKQILLNGYSRILISMTAMRLTSSISVVVVINLCCLITLRALF